MLEAKSNYLSLTPGTHMVERTDYNKLSSDLHARTRAHTHTKKQRHTLMASPWWCKLEGTLDLKDKVPLVDGPRGRLVFM